MKKLSLREKVLFLLALGVSCFYVLFSLLLLPAHQGLKEKQRILEAKQLKMDKQNRLMNTRPIIDQAYGVLSLETLSPETEVQELKTNLQKYLEGLVNGSGMDLLKLHTLPEGEDGPFLLLRAEVDAMGSLSELTQFILKLKDFEKDIHLDDLRIISGKEQKGKQRVSLKMIYTILKS